MAKLGINNLKASESKKKQMLEKIENTEEFTGYMDNIAQSNKVSLMDNLSFLMLPFEDYRKKGGNLDSKEKMQWKAAVAAELGRIATGEGAANKSDVSAAKLALTYIENDLNKGKPVNLQAIQDLRNIIETTPGFNAADHIKLSIAEASYELINNQAGMPFYIQRKNLQNYMEAAKNGSPEGSPFNMKVVDNGFKAMDAQITRVMSEAMQVYEDAGYTLTEIQWPNIDPSTGTYSKEGSEKFIESLKGREQDERKMFEIYGVTQGPLTPDEAQLGFLNRIPNRQENAFFSLVAQGMSPESAEMMYTQMGAAGENQASVMRGILTSRGQEGVANNIALGAQLRETSPEQLTDIDNQIKLKLQEMSLGMWPGNLDKFNRTYHSVVDAYVGTSIGTEDLINLNEDKLEKMFTDVNGPTMTQAGVRKPTFHPDMNEVQSKNWFARLPDSFFNSEEFGGGVDDGEGGRLDPVELRMGFNNGDLKFENADDRWIVSRSDGTALLRADKDGAYYIKYDPGVQLEESFWENRLMNENIEKSEAYRLIGTSVWDMDIEDVRKEMKRFK